jgi:hypothetical protein
MNCANIGSPTGKWITISSFLSAVTYNPALSLQTTIYFFENLG